MLVGARLNVTGATQFAGGTVIMARRGKVITFQALYEAGITARARILFHGHSVNVVPDKDVSQQDLQFPTRYVAHKR